MPRDREILESALLAVRWQQGDSAAFDGLVETWEQPLFYYLRRLTDSEADAWELLQETWLKVLKSLGTLRDPHTLPSFLYSIARNTAMSHLRKRSVSVSDEVGEMLPDEGALDEIAAFDAAEQVHHAIDRLSLPQREVLTLYYLQDLSMEEIAALVDLPVGTVKSRIHYAKQAIGRLIKKGE